MAFPWIKYLFICVVVVNKSEFNFKTFVAFQQMFEATSFPILSVKFDRIKRH